MHHHCMYRKIFPRHMSNLLSLFFGPYENDLADLPKKTVEKKTQKTQFWTWKPGKQRPQKPKWKLSHLDLFTVIFYFPPFWGPKKKGHFSGVRILREGGCFYGLGSHGIYHQQTTTIWETIFGSLTFHPHRISSQIQGDADGIRFGFGLSMHLGVSLNGKMVGKSLGMMGPYLFFSPPKGALCLEGDIPNK